MRKNIWLVVLIISVVVTPVLMLMTFKQRGYFAIGGECMVWVIPLSMMIKESFEKKEGQKQ